MFRSSPLREPVKNEDHSNVVDDGGCKEGDTG